METVSSAKSGTVEVTADDLLAKAHPFERQGLGKAPFTFHGISEKVCSGQPDANGVSVGYEGQPAGTCAYCCQGIRYCCHIKSADGKEFVVGCDCVKKIDREDNRLVSQVERAKKAIESKQRAARKAKREAPERERIAAALLIVDESIGIDAAVVATERYRVRRDALYGTADGPYAYSPTTERGTHLLETLSGQPHPSIKDKTLYDYVLYLAACASHSGLLRMARIVEGASK